MSDKPLTRAELAEIKRLRIGKPASRALPADAYRPQDQVARYERERMEMQQLKKNHANKHENLARYGSMARR